MNTPCSTQIGQFVIPTEPLGPQLFWQYDLLIFYCRSINGLWPTNMAVPYHTDPRIWH
jgi:hypothetical protein